MISWTVVIQKFQIPEAVKTVEHNVENSLKQQQQPSFFGVILKTLLVHTGSSP